MPELRVILLPEAEENVAVIHAWLAEKSAEGARRWYLAFSYAMERLRKQPTACALAAESRHFELEIRELVFKTRYGLPYRLLFTIQGNEVRVVYVRGPGQDWVKSSDS